MVDISVIIPVYNKASYLGHCVQSVLAQQSERLESLEILLIDDGSTDGSGAICDELSHSSSLIKVFHTPNGGVTAARRIGVENAIGQYVAFVDADDALPGLALARLHDKAKETGADEVIGRFVTQHGKESPLMNGDETADSMIRQILRNTHKFPVLWGILFRRGLLDGCLDASREIIEGEDKLMQVKVLLKQPKIAFCEHIVYNYNEGVPNSRAHTLDVALKRDKALKDAICERFNEFSTDFTIHQLKDYELLVCQGNYSSRKYYKNQLQGLLSKEIPMLDRLALRLPPRIARLAISLRKSLL